jgi:hypothetical protein
MGATPIVCRPTLVCSTRSCVLPGDPDAAHQGFEHGIGPGCIGEDGMGGFLGYAMPPVRLREVCESLDEDALTRCCLQSVCSTDYGQALACLGEMLEDL